MSDRPSRPVLLYDAECRLCRFVARTVARLDRRSELLLLPFREEAASPLLEGVPAEARYDTWRLVAERGSWSGYGRGAVQLLRAMRLTRPAARVAELVPSGMLDRLYRVVARNRGRLGRLVPDGPAPRRYP